MLAVLVGIINRTNWKKPKQRHRNFSITVQESEHTHNRTREDARKTLCALSFCLCIRKGKSNTDNTQRKDKATKEDKQRKEGKLGRTKGQKQEQREKIKGKTRNKPQNRQTPHAHKSPTSHANRQSIQTHTTTIKPAKNPLKTPNRATFAINAPQAKQERDKKHHQRTRATIRQVLKPRSPANLRTSGHAKRQATDHLPPVFLPRFQKYV